jgi:hypothetical protein
MIGREFEDELERQFQAAGFNFEREPAIGGLRPDFLVRGPHGEVVVIETKIWDPKGGNTARALEQVNRYLEVTGADHAFLVLPDLKRTFREKGVVSAETIVPALKRLFQHPARLNRLKHPIPDRTDRTIFAAMPFTREYDDTYFVAMSFAAEQVGAACKRVDQTEFAGDIVGEIKRLIRESIAVIVDLSEGRANVLYETGYAHALDKPSVHICSTDLSALPFDVRSWNTIQYNKGQTMTLREPLVKRLKAVVGK